MPRTYETDFYKRVVDVPSLIEIIVFKHPTPTQYPKESHDWYIITALEKANKVKVDRHLLTYELLLHYRWAIREGYQHQLDPALQREYDHPRHRNTIAGIQGYIARIKKLSKIPG